MALRFFDMDMSGDDGMKGMPADARRWTIEAGGHKTIDLDGVTGLTVALAGGRIDVLGSDDATCRLEVSRVRGREVQVLFADGHLVVRHPWAADGAMHFDIGLGDFLRRKFRGDPTPTGDYAEVSLLVPRSTATTIHCVAGDTLVSGLADGARLDTVSGTVLAEGMSGALKLDTVSGKVEARNHHGAVKADTVSGDVVISGDVRDVDVDAVSGDLYLDAFGNPGRIDFDGVNGSATLRLDPELRVAYKAETVGGSAIIDGVKHKTSFKTLKLVDGPENGPTCKVHFDAVGGRLKVVRRAVEPFDPFEGEGGGASDGDAGAVASGQSAASGQSGSSGQSAASGQSGAAGAPAASGPSDDAGSQPEEGDAR